MQKADFEKNVEQKMQELRFRPSDEVWKRVEAGIAEKRRRRPVLLWLFFFAILIGGSYYFLYHPDPSNKAIVSTHQPGQAIAGKQNDQTKEAGSGHQQANSFNAPQTTQKENNDEYSMLKTLVSKKKTSTTKINPYSSKEITESTQGKNSVDYSPIDTGHLNNNDNTSIENGLRSSSPIRINLAGVSNDITDISTNEHFLTMAENPLPFVEAPAIHIKKINWQFGMSADGGFSDISEQLFHRAGLADIYVTPQNASPSSSSYYRPSEVKHGPFFSVGAYVNKYLGTKWKIGLGAAYQYFSTQIKVGTKVDSAMFVNQSNFSMNRVDQYYKSAGNTPYHNQYHFLSIPLSVEWQFAKRFAWENQLTYSRLLHTNALHFDAINGAYYEKSSFFNKDQFSLSTGVLFGMNKNRIQIGPNFQYALTNLLSNGAKNPTHLTAVALKAIVELWKN